MNCPKCGAPVSGSGRFCAKCGSPINRQAEQTQSNTSTVSLGSFKINTKAFLNVINSFKNRPKEQKTISYVIMGAGVAGFLALFFPIFSAYDDGTSASFSLLSFILHGPHLIEFIDESISVFYYFLVLLLIFGTFFASFCGIIYCLAGNILKIKYASAGLIVCGLLAFIIFNNFASNSEYYSINMSVYMLVISGIIMIVSVSMLNKQ